MRARVANLLADGIDIVSQCEGHDAEVWLATARAELSVLNAKAQLREALQQIEGPIAKPKFIKPAFTPKPVPAPTPKGKGSKGNGKAAATVRL